MQKILFIFLSPLFFLHIQAQENLLQQKISLEANNTTMEDILKQITSIADIHFVYSPDLVNLKKKISFQVNEVPLKNVLDKLFENTDIQYTLLGGQLILKQVKKARKYTISGTVFDSRTREQLIFASIAIPEHAITTTSNAYGFFSFKAEGDIAIHISYVGYKSYVRDLHLTKDTSIDVFLLPDTTSMKEIVISDHSWKQGLYSINTGLMRINMQSLKEIPKILGESDVLKGLQSLPGVQASHEGSNSLYIRGGNPDQNLYILDGVSMYNINHLFGYFSVFNADAIQNTMLYKSGFPAKYGGRLSSIVDMKLKEGNSKQYQGSFAIGTLTSSFSAEGPIGKKASFYVSGRRTYLDLITTPLLYYYNLKNDDSVKVKIKAHFYDVTAKVNINLSEKSHLFFSNYIGGDLFGSKNYTESIEEGGDLKWSNFTSALRWNYKLNSKLFINSTFTYSQFSFNLDQIISGTDTLKRLIELNSNFNSGIIDYSARTDWEYYADENHSFSFGIGATVHDFNGGSVRSFEKLEYESNTFEISNVVPYTMESHIYAEDIWKMSPKISAQIGIHAASIGFAHHYDYSIQPRLGLHYLFNEKWAMKASYSRMGQFLHLSSAGVPGSLSFEIWVPVANYVKPQHSQQYAAGPVFIPNKCWEFSMELYYKKFTDLLERKLYIDEYSGILEWGRNWTVSDGTAKGMEIMVQKKQGKLRGWLTYTLSISDRTADTYLGRMTSTLENSHKHMINCKLSYPVTQKIHFSTLWSFGSGAMVTFPKQKYQSVIKEIPALYYIEGFNNYQLAPYHRLDIGINFTKKKRWYKRTWNIGVYNTYNKRNPNFIEIRNNRFIKYSYFSLVPSISFIMDFNTP